MATKPEAKAYLTPLQFASRFCGNGKLWGYGQNGDLRGGNVHTDLQSTLKEKNFIIDPTFDGEFHRFNRAGSNTGWYKGKRLEFGGKEYCVLSYGDWKTGESHQWQTDAELTDAEKKSVKHFVAEQQKAEREAREKVWAEIAVEVEKEWETFADRGTTPYLQRKQIPELYGARIMSNAHGDPIVIVPMRDVDGKLWNYQRIYAQKLSKGDKFMLELARVEGLMHVFGEIKNDSTVYVAEGFATAASIRLALPDCCVVAAFNAGNLHRVCESIKAKYPQATICVCADNDAWKKEGSTYVPNPMNIGIEKGTEAAGSVGGKVVWPVFKTPTPGFTDFNDLHAAEGLEVVKAQILNPPAQLLPEKRPKFTEVAVAKMVLSKWDGLLVRQDKSLFRYDKTHWVELDSHGIDKVKNLINAVCGDGLDSKKVDSIYKTFFRMVDHVRPGVNLFSPNPRFGNFLDGTLQISRNDENGIYTLSFREHRPEDYLSWVVPINYKCDRAVRNEKFDKMVAEILEGERDAAGMLRSIKQMGGAMLVPTFSQMFFLYGVSGSRKSTLALTLAKVVSDANRSHCDPARMENFEIEGMINKLVNMHTDIDDHSPLPRGFLKRFEDNDTVQVNRKGKPVANCRLPQVHVYCANDLPPNFEKGRAFLRRLTLVQFNKDLTNDKMGDVIKHYEDILWAAGPEGIINFCVEGLHDLLNHGGKFHQSCSSKTSIEAWQKSYDPVEQFFDEIKSEAGLILDDSTQITTIKEGEIQRKNLWKAYGQWHKEAFHFPPRIGKKGFFDAVRSRKYGEKAIKGVDYFVGLVEKAV